MSTLPPHCLVVLSLEVESGTFSVMLRKQLLQEKARLTILQAKKPISTSSSILSSFFIREHSVWRTVKAPHHCIRSQQVGARQRSLVVDDLEANQVP